MADSSVMGPGEDQPEDEGGEGVIALLTGIFTGFVMCIPIGPLNVWVVNTCLRRGVSRALAVSLGGALMDVVYFYIILSGLSFFEMSEKSVFYFKLLGILFILGLGLKELLTKEVVIEGKMGKETPQGLLAGLVTGILVYVSNPTLILTMTALGAFVKSLELFPFHQVNIVIISLGLGVGAFLWFTLLTRLTEYFRESIKDKALLILTRVSGGLMVGLALLMTHQLYFSKGNL